MKNNSHTNDISRFIDDKSQDEENQENNINFFIKLSEFLMEEHHMDQVFSASNKAVEYGGGG